MIVFSHTISSNKSNIAIPIVYAAQHVRMAAWSGGDADSSCALIGVFGRANRKLATIAAALAANFVFTNKTPNLRSIVPLAGETAWGYRQRRDGADYALRSSVFIDVEEEARGRDLDCSAAQRVRCRS